MDIVCMKSGQNRYFVGQRLFELPELKLLVDAVESSRFITKKKSAALIRKLGHLTSTARAEQLNRRIYMGGTPKPENESVYYNVDSIRAAIQKKRKIVFQYFEYTPKKEKARKHDGYQYRFGPYAMIWNRDCCYAVGWSEKHGKIAQFRVDRTTAVELLEQAAVQTPDFDPAEYVRKVFGMYLDDLCTVELLCDNEVMRGRIDRFGETVQTETVGEIIPGWCSLGGKPTLFKTRCEKKEVIEELKTQFCEMAQQYKKVMTPDMRKKISERYNK